METVPTSYNTLKWSYWLGSQPRKQQVCVLLWGSGKENLLLLFNTTQSWRAKHIDKQLWLLKKWLFFFFFRLYLKTLGFVPPWFFFFFPRTFSENVLTAKPVFTSVDSARKWILNMLFNLQGKKVSREKNLNRNNLFHWLHLFVLVTADI